VIDPNDNKIEKKIEESLEKNEMNDYLNILKPLEPMNHQSINLLPEGVQNS